MKLNSALRKTCSHTAIAVVAVGSLLLGISNHASATPLPSDAAIDAVNEELSTSQNQQSGGCVGNAYGCLGQAAYWLFKKAYCLTGNGPANQVAEACGTNDPGSNSDAEPKIATSQRTSNLVFGLRNSNLKKQVQTQVLNGRSGAQITLGSGKLAQRCTLGERKSLSKGKEGDFIAECKANGVSVFIVGKGSTIGLFTSKP